MAGSLVLLSIVLITIYFREPVGGGLHGVQSTGATVLRPFEVGATRVAQPFRDGYGWFSGVLHAKSENGRLLSVGLASPAPVCAYAVLSHEAIIDAAWETHIKPLLLKKFPQATEEDLSRAQAYAYGGAIIQDMGYYPYGKPFFSDLTHYIRSGDFIQALLRDSKDINEFAFAIGALAHYAADNDGHRLGINRAVPVLYPGLRKKFGDSVSFEDDRLAHVKTEFGFDVLWLCTVPIAEITSTGPAE